MRTWLVALLLLAGATGDIRAADVIVNQQVIFTSSDSTSLAGTLTMPAGVTFKVPGVVMLQGSGPTDRDGNQPAMRSDLLRQIAEDLARQGIVSLRYDKRGMYANAAGRPGNQEDYAQFFNWDRFVADAYVAYSFMRGLAAVDADRTALLGHSEGGLIALDLASRLQGNEMPRALVLLSTAGRRLDVVMREQIERLLIEQKATPAQRRQFLAANDRIVKAIVATGHVPEEVPPGLAAFYPPYLGPFWQSVFRLEPTGLAGLFGGPVLLLQGDADLQVSAERDALLLDQALKRRESDDHALFILPRTSHYLKPLNNNGDPGFEGEIDPGVLNRLGDWLLSRMMR